MRNWNERIQVFLLTFHLCPSIYEIPPFELIYYSCDAKRVVELAVHELCAVILRENKPKKSCPCGTRVQPAFQKFRNE